MFGYVAYRAPEMPPVRVIEGARFRAVYVLPESTLRARLSARAAARALARDGVREAVFPPEYPHREIFARRGIAAPQLTPLYRATAAAIVRRHLAQSKIDPRRASVTFAAESVTPELRRVVFALAADVRYIALAKPHGGDALAQALRRELGVAAQVGPLDTLPSADLVVAFDDIAGDALRLDEALRVVYDSPYPNELLAALWRAGAVNADALRVKNVTRNPA